LEELIQQLIFYSEYILRVKHRVDPCFRGHSDNKQIFQFSLYL